MSTQAKERLIFLVLLGAFVTLFFETRFEHRFLIAGGHTPQVWIPVVMSGVLVFACLISFSKNAQARGAAMVLFFLGMVTGVLGIYFHTKGDLLKLQMLVTASLSQTSERPLIAPMSIAGLSMIGLILNSNGRKRAQ